MNVLVLKLLLDGNAAGGLGNLNTSHCELDNMWIYTQHLLPEELENKGRVEFFCCQKSDTGSFSSLVTKSIKLKAAIFRVLAFPYVFFFSQNSLSPVSPPACYQDCPCHMTEPALGPQHVSEPPRTGLAPSVLAFTMVAKEKCFGVFPQGTTGRGFKWPL